MTTKTGKSVRQAFTAVREALLSVLRGELVMCLLYRLLGFRYFYTARGSAKPSAELIRKTQRTLWVLSGELNGAVWNAPAVKAALEYLTSLARKGEVSLYTVSTRADRHFWVADGRHVKIEEPHSSKEERRRGYVAFNAGRLAATLEERMRFALRYASSLYP